MCKNNVRGVSHNEKSVGDGWWRRRAARAFALVSRASARAGEAATHKARSARLPPPRRIQWINSDKWARPRLLARQCADKITWRRLRRAFSSSCRGVPPIFHSFILTTRPLVQPTMYLHPFVRHLVLCNNRTKHFYQGQPGRATTTHLDTTMFHRPNDHWSCVPPIIMPYPISHHSSSLVSHSVLITVELLGAAKSNLPR